MRRLVLILAVVVVSIATVSLSASPKQTTAGVAWPPLLNCPDVNGDGAVSGLDMFALLGSYNSAYPSSNYLLLHDLDGDQSVGWLDFLEVLDRFGESCPLIDTQVAQATLATMKYRDWSVANAAGYNVSTQYVPQMGIHVSKNNYTMTFDPTDPIGLIYTNAGGGTPGELIGMWYVVPVQEVCDFFVPGTSPCQPVDVEPVGFGTNSTDEDNLDIDTCTAPLCQRGWHTHTNLCVYLNPPRTIELGEGFTAQDCFDSGGVFNFGTYGWMSHLYNFIPNPAGRFQMWNSNLP